MLQTFVLMWNPEISSFTKEDFNALHATMTDAKKPTLNWSIHEWENCHKGDRFVMVRCGRSGGGLVMAGRFASAPYAGDDWGKQGKPRHCADLEIRAMFNPDEPLLTTDELREAIPDFDWAGGHSGRVLTTEQSQILDATYMLQSSNRMTEVNTIAFGASAQQLKEYRTKSKMEFGVEMDNDNYEDLIVAQGRAIMLVVVEPPMYNYDCYWYNGGSFPYLLRDDRKFVAFVSEDGEMVAFRIKNIRTEVANRFGFDPKRSKYTEDPNGDCCYWRIVFELEK